MKWVVSIPHDKLLHFAVSAIIAMVVVVFSDLLGLATWLNVVITIAVISAVGIAKEYAIDDTPDIWDIVANFAGAAVVIIAYIV